MGSRVANVATICKFLRDRNDHARKTVDAMMSLPVAQRSDVLNSADYEAETKTKYTVKELAEAIPSLEAYQIRYALIGHRPHEIINKLQKEELYSKGIVIDYDTYGASTPAFEYDADVMYSHIKSKKRDVNDPDGEVVASVTTAPAESVTPEPTPETVVEETKKEECIYAHVPEYLRLLMSTMVNEKDVEVGQDDVLYINGSPVYGTFVVTAEWCEANGYPVDVTRDVIKLDNSLSLRRDLRTK